MTTIFRDGLIEALLDFGVDLGASGLDFLEEAHPAIHIGDVSKNYKPAIRGQAVARCQMPAGGAGNYGGLLIFAPPTGLWVLHVYISAGATWVCSQITATLAAVRAINWNTPITWSVWGDEPGQVLVNGTLVGPPVNFLATQALFGTADPTIPIAGSFELVGGNALGTSGMFPMWIPPGQCFYLQNANANASANVSVGVQFCAQNPGRFP